MEQKNIMTPTQCLGGRPVFNISTRPTTLTKSGSDSFNKQTKPARSNSLFFT
jgi:hypothetical protein